MSVLNSSEMRATVESHHCAGQCHPWKGAGDRVHRSCTDLKTLLILLT